MGAVALARGFSKLRVFAMSEARSCHIPGSRKLRKSIFSAAILMRRIRVSFTRNSKAATIENELALIADDSPNAEVHDHGYGVRGDLLSSDRRSLECTASSICCDINDVERARSAGSTSANQIQAQ